MREILFKAKRKNNGEWIEGDYNHFIDGRAGIEHTHQHLGSGIYTRVTIEVDPETVCQYTGLKDRNGKKIFEGDIVESKFTKKPYPVYFGEYSYTNEYGEEDDACGWYNIEEGKYKTALGCKTDVWATIIGNIYDNPELMGDE